MPFEHYVVCIETRLCPSSPKFALGMRIGKVFFLLTLASLANAVAPEQVLDASRGVDEEHHVFQDDDDQDGLGVETRTSTEVANGAATNSSIGKLNDGILAQESGLGESQALQIGGSARDSSESLVLNIEGVTPTGALPPAPQCTAEERSFWSNNPKFSQTYQAMSLALYGSAARTTASLVEAFGNFVSELCLSCLGQATGCGTYNCPLQCMFNQAGEKCQSCIAKFCRPALLTCTGAAGVHELPLPPSTNARPGPPVSPTAQTEVKLEQVEKPEEGALEVGSVHTPSVRRVAGGNIAQRPYGLTRGEILGALAASFLAHLVRRAIDTLFDPSQRIPS